MLFFSICLSFLHKSLSVALRKRWEMLMAWGVLLAGLCVLEFFYIYIPIYIPCTFFVFCFFGWLFALFFFPFFFFPPGFGMWRRERGI